MTSKPRIVINADDFGIDCAVNEAIVECHQAGVLSSTTLMVNQFATDGAAELAEANPALGVGLHFNITLGRPLSPPERVSSLLDDCGYFRARGRLERRAALGLIDPEHVAEELRAQYAAFIERLGAPTHLDSHQHVHLLPGCFTAVAAFVGDVGLPVRLPFPHVQAGGASLKRRARAFVLRRLVDRAVRSLAHDVRSNTDFRSIFDLETDPARATPETYAGPLLAGLEDGAELMVHVATHAGAGAGLVDIGAVYEREYQCLLSPAFAEALHARFRLVRFDEAARPLNRRV